MNREWLLMWLFAITLSACNTIGNVVPQKGATMEQMYDGMGRDGYSSYKKKPVKIVQPKTTAVKANKFQSAANPTLDLYVYPHEQTSAYETKFTAYDDKN